MLLVSSNLASGVCPPPIIEPFRFLSHTCLFQYTALSTLCVRYVLVLLLICTIQFAVYLGPDGPWTTWNVPAEAAIGAAIHLILGYYVLKQTQRVRCVFDKKSFEFKNIKDNQLVTKPNKNYVKGTINKWDCDAVVDFGYFPSKSYPLITWFKETDTSSAQWGEYGLWGQLFTDPMPNAPAIHFFPGFIDMERWEREMRKRGAQQQ